MRTFIEFLFTDISKRLTLYIYIERGSVIEGYLTTAVKSSSNSYCFIINITPEIELASLTPSPGLVMK